ncbi:NADH-quinone oxidoreductase subunit J [bacterium]|nr:NADH-quinone oxidoreductase subunit J [bacterium]
MNEAEIIKSITFYGFSLLILIFAILTIFANRILYSLLYAVIAFFCAGGIFFSLGADYNAVVQIMIYGVAVPVIFLFAIMFTSKKEGKTAYLSYAPRFFISFISIFLLFMLLWYSVKFAVYLNQNSANYLFAKLSNITIFDSVFAISNGLYVNYGLALFLFAITVLSVIVGISVLNVIKENKHVK